MNTNASGLSLFLLVVIGTLSISWAADMRTWSDRKGRTLEASLVRLDREEVILRLKSGKQVKVKISTLSADDGAYLSELAAGKQTTTETAAKGTPNSVPKKLGVPEKEVRIDTKTFVKQSNYFTFPDSDTRFDIFQTEHFLIMTDGSLRPSKIAETAERLWHGMAVHHPTFRDKYGDKRRAIFAIQDEENQAEVGKWYGKVLNSANQTEASVRWSQTWPNSTGSQITLPQAQAEEHGLFRQARVFKVSSANERSFKEVFGPFLTNTISSDMISVQVGGVSEPGSRGYFALTTGHAFYKEIQLAGRSSTSIISAEYDNDELTRAKGFGDGTGWAKELKKMVRKENAIPSVSAMYNYTARSVTPTQLVLLYSFSHFAQSTPQLLAGYARIAETIDSSNRVPSEIELAKLLGFESVEALEKAWIEHIGGSAFK